MTHHTQSGSGEELVMTPDGDEIEIHDCWNRIGVEGNGSCQELVRYVHCRNCPVYSAAGLRLLDRRLTSDYRREQTEHYAVRKKLTAPAKVSVLIFRLGQEWFALPSHALQEVAENRPMHSLPPRRRSVAIGLVNVRGELLVCASLSRLLGMDETHGAPVRGQLPLLLVATWNGSRVAFPVDEVQRIHRFGQDELRDAPATVSRSALTYARGVFVWRERTVGYLDAGLLFPALDRSLK